MNNRISLDERVKQGERKGYVSVWVSVEDGQVFFVENPKVKVGDIIVNMHSAYLVTKTVNVSRVNAVRLRLNVDCKEGCYSKMKVAHKENDEELFVSSSEDCVQFIQEYKEEKAWDCHNLWLMANE